MYNPVPPTTTLSSLSPPPPPQTFALISSPTPHILLVTFNRPKSLNCIPTAAHHELDTLFAWYDTTPTLRCAIVTGSGRAFCAGADLKEWNSNASSSTPRREMPASGFGGLSRRTGKKPIIAAVNGLAFGGGMEMVVNLDMVVASRSASFALPEVKRGVVAIAGALPRLGRVVGRQRAMEMVLTGRTVSASEALSWGIVNHVADDAAAVDTDVLERPVVGKAIELAKMISENSPDSVIVSRAGVVMGWEDGSVEHASTSIQQIYGDRLNGGENIREGLRAFVEKRGPRWVDSKL